MGYDAVKHDSPAFFALGKGQMVSKNGSFREQK